MGSGNQKQPDGQEEGKEKSLKITTKKQVKLMIFIEKYRSFGIIKE